jgi:hypothetical protein
VTQVDAFEHGAGSHNPLIDHDNGDASLYGHLLQRPDLNVGLAVSRRRLVGDAGDLDHAIARARDQPVSG